MTTTAEFRRRVRGHTSALARASLNIGGGRRKIFRDYLFRLAGRFTSALAVEGDGCVFIVSTADRSVGRATFIHGGYDAEVMARLIETGEYQLGHPLLRGKTFVDVGANIGTTTIPAVLTYGAAAAVAFEPLPDACALLACNVALNGIANQVRIKQLAISDRVGTVEMEVSADHWGDRRVRPTHDSGRAALGEEQWATVPVPVSRLDDALQDLGVDLDDVGLVWVDTQGHEAHVLAGARQVLDRRIPLVVEYWPYGLRRSGGLERLHAELARAYDEFIDIRAVGRAAPRPTADLPDLAAQYATADEYTDLLLVR